MAIEIRHSGQTVTVAQERGTVTARSPSYTIGVTSGVLVGGVPEWEQPDSTNPYMKGDHVIHNGSEWVSDIDYNVFEPGVAGWSVVT